MTSQPQNPITVTTTINAPVSRVWTCWTEPEHIQQWNNASPDWHTPRATNDLRPGGTFCSTMAARDGSAQFDFTGTYDAVETERLITYTIADGRKVKVQFETDGQQVRVTETFDAETVHSPELQRQGWQAILDNFKRYVERTSV